MHATDWLDVIYTAGVVFDDGAIAFELLHPLPRPSFYVAAGCRLLL